MDKYYRVKTKYGDYLMRTNREVDFDTSKFLDNMFGKGEWSSRETTKEEYEERTDCKFLQHVAVPNRK